jgi:hypothetical protein
VDDDLIQLTVYFRAFFSIPTGDILVRNIMRFTIRKDELEEARKRLSWQWPRLQIMFILALTGTASFLVSFLLLRIGVTPMVVRYPIAIAVAYFVFIALIGFWLWLQRNDLDADIDIIPDLTGVGVPLPDLSDASSVIPSGLSGQGGDFAGGGAGGSWKAEMSLPVPHFSASTAGPSSGSSGGGGSFDLSGLDADDAVWIVLAVLALLGGLIAIGYVVYIAPVLFTEVLADSLFAASLYKSVKKARGDLWLSTVVRKTIIPAIVVLVFFTLAGYFVQRAFPETSSLGDAMRIFF